MAQKKNMDASSPIIIKKYANRRLYNTETSSYITLELLSQMTREGAALNAKIDKRQSPFGPGPAKLRHPSNRPKISPQLVSGGHRRG
jgi:hypothetical protein